MASQKAIQRAVGTRVRRGILRVLIARRGRGATPKEMARLFGVVPTVVVNDLNQLVRLGAVERIGPGDDLSVDRLYALSPVWVQDPATRAALGCALEQKPPSADPGIAN